MFILVVKVYSAQGMIDGVQWIIVYRHNIVAVDSVTKVYSSRDSVYLKVDQRGPQVG
jgi:hypothetical protein